jgi:hypothetical protein
MPKKAQITPEQIFLVAGCDEKAENISQWETRQNCPMDIGKKVVISIPFL